MASKTQYYTAMSIDGYIAGPGSSLDWLFQAGPSTAKEDRFSAFFGQVGAMAMGAATYLWAVEHDQLLHNPGKWQEYYGTTPCWIFSHRDLPAVLGPARNSQSSEEPGPAIYPSMLIAV